MVIRTTLPLSPSGTRRPRPRKPSCRGSASRLLERLGLPPTPPGLCPRGPVVLCEPPSTAPHASCPGIRAVVGTAACPPGSGPCSVVWVGTVAKCRRPLYGAWISPPPWTVGEETIPWGTVRQRIVEVTFRSFVFAPTVIWPTGLPCHQSSGNRLEPVGPSDRPSSVRRSTWPSRWHACRPARIWQASRPRHQFPQLALARHYAESLEAGRHRSRTADAGAGERGSWCHPAPPLRGWSDARPRPPRTGGPITIPPTQITKNLALTSSQINADSVHGKYLNCEHCNKMSIKMHCAVIA